MGGKSERNHNSWSTSSKVNGTTSTRQYRRSASSILSSDSDIRFTRKKLTSQYRCGCCLIASFLVLLLAAAAAVYVGYKYFLPAYPDEQVFRITFKVTEGDFFTSNLTDVNSTDFKRRAANYRERLNLLFRRSYIRHGFVGSEVLALDGTENKDLIVHSNVRIDPLFVAVEAKDITTILTNAITLPESAYFQNLTIDPESLEVIPDTLILQMTTVASTESIKEPSTMAPQPPRQCVPLQLLYCNKLNHNSTTYPNIFHHKNYKDVKDDIIAFRELVDAECYRHAYDFLCQVLQPRCRSRNDGDKMKNEEEREDEMILPCRSFCRDFMAGCGGRLPEKYRDYLDCTKFPEFAGKGSCITKPGCIEELKAKALSPRICDGIIDCQDVSDEKMCTYCPVNNIHCGIGRSCIHRTKRCDGRVDCPDGSDERACLSLAPTIDSLRKIEVVTPHLPILNSEGFVTFNEKGEVGKLCTENLNNTYLSPSSLKSSNNETIELLHTVASSLCKTLSFQNVQSVQVETDYEPNVQYVSMKDPQAAEINFIRTPCPTRQVLKVSCSNLECGIQQTHGINGLKSLGKMSSHGDWPWHVALFKEEAHICDGTLVSPEWVATTTSCFQGQPKAEWRARFATIRLSSTSPWDQERRIVGMVKSPVEGCTIALIKLDRPVMVNDFVRPICLPKEGVMSLESIMGKKGKESDIECNTLGWMRNRDQLQRIQVKVVEKQKCENISISNVNSICTETIHGQDDCNEEEFAGSPMMCSSPNVTVGGKWHLIGIANWRIACTKNNNGLLRPRMYDKISSNINWILETINSSVSDEGI